MEIKILQVLQSKQKKITFTIDGKIFKANIVKGPSDYTVYLQNAGRVTSVTVPQVQVGHKLPLGQQNSSAVFTPAKSLAGPMVVPGDHELMLKSPLAGLVIKVRVAAGQFVEKNQPLIVIESMKMENEISAPFSAFIKTLSISEGNLVKPNQVIVIFERKGESDATTKSFCEQEVSER